MTITESGIEGFGGAVVHPGSPDYDELRAVWNAMHDRRPALIALCESPADVAAAIRHARAAGLPIAVRGGGHSLPGFSTVDDGLVVDLRRLNAVTVDPVARRAVVQGGALLGDLDRATQQHGLAVPAGVISHTGAGGLTLGGGVGRLMRRYGLTVDSLLSVDLVTADGDLVHASSTEHPDLFWALRGGGGNFGVVTSFEYACHQVGDLVVLATFHSLEAAGAMLRRADAEMADPATPDELLWTSFVRKAPPLPWMPEHLVGEPGVMSLVEWSGDLAEGRARLERLRDELAPTASSLDQVPFLVMQTMGDEVFRPGLHSYIKATFADELTDELVEALLRQGAALGSPLTQVEVLSVGGAIARVPAADTAFPHRTARWLVNIPASWADPAETERELQWVRDTFAAIRPHARGGAYVNFMEADDVDADQTAYGETLARLQRVKATWDPANVFRRNQNITPAFSAHALAQQALWGTDPDGWAEVAEPLNRPLFAAMLDATGVGPATRVLDVGCGSGLALSLAADRGAAVSGIDISPGLLGRAARLVPAADLRLGDLAELPYDDQAFDVVLGVNSFQFAADPVAALAGAARVVRAGGLVAASLFAEPERCESTAVHIALSALSPPVRQAEHQPYALSAPGGLERAMTAAGLDVIGSAEVPVDWAYADVDAAVRGLLSSGGGARATQDSGRAAAEAAVRAAVAPFTQPDGRVVMHNVFRYVLASRNAVVRSTRASRSASGMPRSMWS